MRFAFTFLFTAFCSQFCLSQSGDFPFGRVAYSELEMKTCAIDTGAAAVVLKEFGSALINEYNKLIFEYHVKIKILKPNGQRKGDFRFPIYKGDLTEERLLSLQAITSNLQSDNSIRQTKLDPEKIYVEKTNKYVNQIKFALPEVRVGSVIDVKYETESPFLFLFRTWQFQDDIPKIQSEYWCKIPANFRYNITLRGFYKMSKNESEAVKKCIQPENWREKIDCLFAQYGMDNIPAFKEEMYMTAKQNFISAIYFELSEVIRPNGNKTTYAEEWKDVENKLRVHQSFGQQVKKAKSLMEDIVKPLVEKETDPEKKAQIIYDYVKRWYEWNEEDGIYTDSDAKKVYKQRRGNVAEINLALAGALQAFDFDASPLLISTRNHGLPIKVNPQRSSFNYVAVRLKINEKEFLLDATDDLLPFGVLPMRCLNDQGRLISRYESKWIDLKPNQRQKTVLNMDLKMSTSGELKGNLSMQYSGYNALDQRKKINTSEDYLKTLTKELGNVEITNYQTENKEDVTKPFIEKMEVLFEGEGNSGAKTYFNPFLLYRHDRNPFQSAERLYPVDYGSPVELSYIISIELPDGMFLEEGPVSNGFALPNGGGKCVINVASYGNKIVLTCTIILAKSVYSDEEYHSLREFYSRLVQLQQSQFVFKKI